LVQYTFASIGSTAMFHGAFCALASVVGVPPAMGTFITVLPVCVTQYTLVLSTAIPYGSLWFEASVVGVPPAMGIFKTAPPAIAVVQYTFVASTAMAKASLWSPAKASLGGAASTAGDASGGLPLALELAHPAANAIPKAAANHSLIRRLMRAH
jgi:hypothetical protein